MECKLNSYFVAETEMCVKTVSDFCAEYNLQDGKCVNCQAYSYFDAANSTCVPYSENCLDVNEEKLCVSCKGKTYLNAQTNLCEDCKIENCLQCGAGFICAQC